MQQHRPVVKANAHLGMITAERCFPNDGRALAERLGFSELALYIRQSGVLRITRGGRRHMCVHEG